MHFLRSLLLTSLFLFFLYFPLLSICYFLSFFFRCSVRTFRYVSNARVIARESPRFVHATANPFRHSDRREQYFSRLDSASATLAHFQAR